MARSSDCKELAFFAKPPLLVTESKKHFAALRAALTQEIHPCGIIEHMYVAEIAALVWEILRLRRCKTAMVNAAIEDALYSILRRLTAADQDAQDAVVNDWFANPTAKGEVAELLAQHHLDESAIEVEAIQSVSEELGVLDSMLTSLESRRFKALRAIADYRQIFTKQPHQVADRILENDDVPRLIAVTRRPD